MTFPFPYHANTFATNGWNPSDKSSSLTLSGNNTVATQTAGNAVNRTVRALYGKKTGKWYWEILVGAFTTGASYGIGVANIQHALDSAFLGVTIHSTGWFADNRVWIANGAVNLVTYAATNVLSVALDLDNHKIYFRINGGNWDNNAGHNPATNTGGYTIYEIAGIVYPAAVTFNSTVNDVVTILPVSAGWTYSAPSGFSAMSAGDTAAAASGNCYNSADKDANITLHNSSRSAYSASTNAYKSVRSTNGKTSGKWYWEVFINYADNASNSGLTGVMNGTASLSSYAGSDNNGIGHFKGGLIWLGGANIASSATYQRGDTMSVALDLTNSKFHSRVNGGSWNNNGTHDPATNTGGFSIAVITGTLYAAATCYTTFDQPTIKPDSSEWLYSAPSGFSAT